MAKEKGKAAAFGRRQSVPKQAASSHRAAPCTQGLPRQGPGLLQPGFYSPQDGLQPDCFPRQRRLREWKI